MRTFYNRRGRHRTGLIPMKTNTNPHSLEERI